MNPSRILLSVCALLLALTPAGGAAFGEVTISGEAGETVHVSVSVADAENLGAFEFELEYDNTVVEVTEVGLAEFLGSTGRNVGPLGPMQTGANRVKFGALTFGETDGPSGEGAIAVLTFRFLEDGSSPVELVDYQVTNIEGTRQPFSLSLNAGIAVRHVRPLEARRVVVAMPWESTDPSEQVADAARRLAGFLHPEEPAGPADWRIVQPTAETGEEEWVSDGTLLLLDTPENLDKAIRFLANRKQQDVQDLHYRSVWAREDSLTGRSLFGRVPEVLAGAGLSDADVEAIRAKIDAGHPPLGFRLVIARDPKTATPEFLQTLVSSEVRRINQGLQDPDTVVIGLPESGELLVVGGELETLWDLRKSILHTQPAGDLNTLKPVRLDSDVIWVADRDHYLFPLRTGANHSEQIVVEVGESEVTLTRTDGRESAVWALPASGHP